MPSSMRACPPSSAQGREAECPGFDPGSFDHVLCDVPCSALGLRPRCGALTLRLGEMTQESAPDACMPSPNLHATRSHVPLRCTRSVETTLRSCSPGWLLILPPPRAPCALRFRHEQTVEELVGTAQYQRRILAAGVGALRPGGTMVFSTCTISHLENEANVRWLLDSFPLRLVPALPRLGGPGLVAPQAQPPLLTAAEAAMVQRFDPGEPASDTIGFFIAKFVKL